MLQRMSTAMLPEHQLAFRHAHRLGIHDLVGGAFLQIAVLVNAGFVGESVSPTMALLGCGPKVMMRAELASRVEMLREDAGLIRQAVVSRLDRHHDLFQGAVPARSPMPLMVHSI